MKKEYKKQSILILLVLLLTTFVLLLNGCGKKVSLDGASFGASSVSMEKYESYTLVLNGCDSKDVTWKSEDNSIAEVKDGVVYAKKKGTTEVSAWIGKSSISCTVSVSDHQYVPVIELNEPDTGIKMGQGGTYAMSAVVSYNGNTYEDAKYEYVAVDDVVEVDDSGVITATELGEGLVAVTAKWRGNVIETSLPVHVVDITTSIEVSELEYEIYLNGKGGDEPGSADLGIVVFDDKVQVKNPYASVTYVEQPAEGDVKGAAVVKQGVVYPRKYGTTHFVAVYKSKAGETYYSAEFAVNVKQTLADYYMTPITGEAYEFFIRPIDGSGTNSVEWDEKLQAYHLINRWKEPDNSRGFIFDKQHLQGIIEHTNVTSITFEYRTDGVKARLDDKEDIFTGYWPRWYVAGTYSMLSSTTDKWIRKTVKLNELPLDEDGSVKTVFILNAAAGMYIRNITLNVEAGKIDYSSFDYMTPIQGKEYEFFIQPIEPSGANYVEWDEKLQAYHLFNNCTEANDNRGFIFDKQYLEGIIANTDVTSITFEYRTDGIKARLDDKEDIFTGYWPRWYVAGTYSMLSSTTDKWIRKTVNLEELPLHTDGSMKTVFLLNAAAGMYVRNITLNVGTGKIDYSKLDYTAPIQGKEYEFFIKAVEPSGANYVEWDEELQAFHLFNNCTEANDNRGFYFDKQYLEGILANTDITTITFEYRTDGIKARENDKEDIFTGYWPRWYVVGEYNMLSSTTDKWLRKTVDLTALPKHTDGSTKTVFLLNAAAGMYIRNITLSADSGEIDYDSFDYMAPIEGKEYEFFIQTVDTSGNNSVEWDETKQAYHLVNRCADDNNNRGFYFDKQYLDGIIANTNATSISFEYQTDGVWTGNQNAQIHTIYEGYWPSWFVAGQYKQTTSDTSTWISAKIDIRDLPKTSDGTDTKTIFLMNSAGGMYVRNIRVNVDIDYTADIEGEAYEFFIKALGDQNSVKWDENEKAYHLINRAVGSDNTRGFIFDKAYLQGIIEKTDATSISFEYRTDGVLSGNPDAIIEDIYEGYWPNWNVANQFKKTTSTTDTWISARIKLADIPEDADGSIKTVFLMNAAAGMYVRNIKVNMAADDVDYDSFDHTTKIEGETFEFVLRPVDTTGANYVEWDETKQAYHLFNNYAGTDDGRGFYFDFKFLERLIADTEATKITLEFQSDQILNGKAHNYSWYWHTGELPLSYFHTESASTDTSVWRKYSFSLEGLKQGDGSLKSLCLMNTGAGLYIRNIELDIPPKENENENDNQNQNQIDFTNFDYTAPIKGEAYESIIRPVDTTGANYVKWDETKQAYHLFNNYTGTDDGRGFYIDFTYLEKLVENTNAKTISLEFQSDQLLNGKAHRYAWYWHTGELPLSYFHAEDASTDTSVWRKYSFSLEGLKQGDGSLKSLCLMNTGAGLYIRNIKLDITVDEVDYDSLDYAAPITGETYEFLIRPVDISGTNYVEWDETKQAYHLVNNYTRTDDGRGFYFDFTYLERVIAETNATKISLEFQSDQILNGKAHRYAWYWHTGELPLSYFHAEDASTDTSVWRKYSFSLESLKQSDGSIKSLCLMNTGAGLYIRNITLE